MKKTILYICLFCLAQTAFAQNFTVWSIPEVRNSNAEMDQVGGDGYALIDMNGDGAPDMVDAQANGSSNVWLSGSNPFWRVYLNNGGSFDESFIVWSIPAVRNSNAEMDQVGGDGYALVDMNGDGRPDMVDAQANGSSNVWLSGSNPFWRVYLNNGAGFDATFTIWSIPAVRNSNAEMDQVGGDGYALVDMNGDGKPDMVDAQANGSSNVWLSGSNPFWRVYLNNGTGFDATFDAWQIPAVRNSNAEMDQIGGDGYALVDMDGDGKPDMVDAQANGSSNVWLSGSNPFWRVYPNTGSGFNGSFDVWQIPAVRNSNAEMDQVGGDGYTVFDMNGDGKLDMVDAQANGSSNVWLSGSNPIWRVYEGDGSSFNGSFTPWQIPAVRNSNAEMDQIGGDGYSMIDMNADGKPDMVDAQANGSSNVWLSGSNPFWRVYLNNGTVLGGMLSGINDLLGTEAISIYPNPASQFVQIDTDENVQVRLYNVHGQEVLSSKEKQINIAHLAQGVYFLSIYNEDAALLQTTKLILK